MAGGVIAALKAQGLDGKVPVTGQDGDTGALNRVALGTQLVSVWKDARALGTAAGEAAVALCSRHPARAGRGRGPLRDPRRQRDELDHPASPTPVTQENLQDVIDAGSSPRRRSARASPPAPSPPAPEPAPSGKRTPPRVRGAGRVVIRHRRRIAADERRR